ncbi:hypothetical protein D3C71_2100690 [compost metagenome]
MNRQQIKVGAAKIFIIFAGPCDDFSGIWQEKCDGVFFNWRRLSDFTAPAITLRTFHDQLAAVMQKHFFIPAVTSEIE